MCVTNLYTDRYPDGREVQYRELSICQYGRPGMPCPTHSILENPVRKIQFGEPTTQYMLTTPIFPRVPPPPPGSPNGTDSEGDNRSRTGRKYASNPLPKPTRAHRKERIIIVDAPPTPRTAPQTYRQPGFVPPSLDKTWGRPITVDERTLLTPRRVPSAHTLGEKQSRLGWEGRGDLSKDYEEQIARQKAANEGERLFADRAWEGRRREEAESEANARRARRIAEQDEAIRRRPAIPIPPRVAKSGPRVDRVQELLDVSDATKPRRGPVVETLNQQELDEQEALRERLRERQGPRRRFAVGPGGRRHRVLYDDGVYRWDDTLAESSPVPATDGNKGITGVPEDEKKESLKESLEPSNHPSSNDRGWLKESVEMAAAPFKCELCGKSFTRGSHLRSHVRDHTEEGLFKCEECGRAFTRKTNRDLHEKSHARPPVAAGFDKESANPELDPIEIGYQIDERDADAETISAVDSKTASSFSSLPHAFTMNSGKASAVASGQGTEDATKSEESVEMFESSESSMRILLNDGSVAKQGDITDFNISVSKEATMSTDISRRDDLSDDESTMSTDAGSIFSASDSISSQSSIAQNIGAPDELIALLVSHEDLKPLLEKASKLVDGSSFKEIFSSLLRKFSHDLNKEAEKATEVLAVNLVRHSRRKVAYAIWRDVYDVGCGPSIAGSLDHSRLDKARKMEETLKRLNILDGQETPAKEDIGEQDSSGDDEMEHKLPNLQQVKNFLVSGQAFKKFLQRFELFVKSKSAKLDVISEDAEEVAILKTGGSVDESFISSGILPLPEMPEDFTHVSAVHAENLIAEVPAVEQDGHASEDVDPGLPSATTLAGEPAIFEFYSNFHRLAALVVGLLWTPITAAFSQAGQYWINKHGSSSSLPRLWRAFWISRRNDWGIALLYIDRLFRTKVVSGQRRLEWKTECGTWLYDDYDNSNPEQLEEFYKELVDEEVSEAADGSQQRSGCAANAAIMPSLTSASASSSSTMQTTSSSTISSSSSTSSVDPSISIPLTNLVNPAPVPPLLRKFFSICVNTGSNLSTLGEIDVSSINHDGEWFSKMWAEYDRLRGFRNRFFRHLLIKPVDVKYVQFTVEEHQRADISFDPPIIPPPDEVAARNYEYTPCPLTTRPSPQTFLHYRACKTCSDSRSKKKKLFHRLPKKLSQGLLDMYLRAGTDEDVLGWGVLIVEGPNKGAITMLSAVILTLSIVVAVVYSGISGDASSGFTIGSFLVAVWVSWMTAFYYYCKES